EELQAAWEREIGQWPALIENPKLEILSATNRENFVQQRVRVELGPNYLAEGWLLVPRGDGPFPGVVVPYYEPDSSLGSGRVMLRDFAFQLARRGFAALAIGSPGGDARKPELNGATCQPL